MFSRRFGLVAALTSLTFAASACSSASAADVTPQEVINHYAEGVDATYNASLTSAKAMDSAVDYFVFNPNEQTFAAAKQAWLKARDDYGRTEAFRFYGGPIDDEANGKEGLINAWPLDEAYIDYVKDKGDAGIINNPAQYPTIDSNVLIEANEKDGETNISTGWHAIEFLLWGQDLSETGPGARPFTDYTTAANAERRKTYLKTASDLLITHLTEVTQAWAPGADNYRKQFVALDPTEALRRMITGIGELSRGELAGERMGVAYLEHSQEDEHSCFSDNTNRDIITNAEGIQNVITGDYPGKAGPGFSYPASTKNSKLADQLLDEVKQSMDDTKAIPAPFDKSLKDGIGDDDPGRQAISKAMTDLGTQTDSIVEGAKALNVTINVS